MAEGARVGTFCIHDTQQARCGAQPAPGRVAGEQGGEGRGDGGSWAQRGRGGAGRRGAHSNCWSGQTGEPCAARCQCGSLPPDSAGLAQFTPSGHVHRARGRRMQDNRSWTCAVRACVRGIAHCRGGFQSTDGGPCALSAATPPITPLYDRIKGVVYRILPWAKR